MAKTPRSLSQPDSFSPTFLSTTQVRLPAASYITIGGVQYSNSSALTLSTASVGLNGLDSGTIAAKTLYSLYAVVSGGSIALVASTSATAPTGFTTATSRAIAYIWTDESALVSFVTPQPTMRAIDIVGAASNWYGTTLGVYVIPLPTWTLTLTPGTWEVTVDTCFNSNPNAGATFSRLALGSTLTAGTSLFPAHLGAARGFASPPILDSCGEKFTQLITVSANTPLYLNYYMGNNSGASSIVNATIQHSTITPGVIHAKRIST